MVLDQYVDLVDQIRQRLGQVGLADDALVRRHEDPVQEVGNQRRMRRGQQPPGGVAVPKRDEGGVVHSGPLTGSILQQVSWAQFRWGPTFGCEYCQSIPLPDQTLARSHCGNEAVNIISIVGEGILVGGA